MSISNKLTHTVLVSALVLGLGTSAALASATDASAATTGTQTSQSSRQLRAGVELLADGTMDLSGSAASGLTVNSNGTTSGAVDLDYHGTALGGELNSDSEFVINVPTELRELAKSANFKQYITGTFKGGLLGTSHTYTQDEISVSSDGSTITFANPEVTSIVVSVVDIHVEINLGQAVTATGIRIANSESNYMIESALIKPESLIDWNLFGDYKATAYFNTNALDPKYDTGEGVDAPYVVQPVTDADTKVSGVAEPNATVVIATDVAGEIGRATANSAGYFTVTIPKQTANTVLLISQTTSEGTSEQARVIVQHSPVTIARPVVNPVKSTDKVVKGTGTTPGSQIIITDDNGTTLGTAYIDNDKNFSVTVNRALVAGESIHVVETNGTDTSNPTSIGVTAGTPIPQPTGIVATALNGSIKGNGSAAGNTIIITDANTGAEIARTIVQSNKSFSVVATGLTPGQFISVVETDGNITSNARYAIVQ